MHLKLSIPKRPSLVHMLPVLDLVALVLVFPLLVSQFAPTGGQSLVLPDARLRIPSFDHAVVVEMIAGNELQLFVDQERVTEALFEEVLKEKEQDWTHGGAPVVLLKMGEHITMKQRAKVVNLLFDMGFDVHEVGKLRGGQ